MPVPDDPVELKREIRTGAFPARDRPRFDDSLVRSLSGASTLFGSRQGGVFAAVVEGRLTATTTVDVVQEFAHAYARRRPRRLACGHALRFAALLSPRRRAT
jgi:hypothetical protein